MLPQHSDIIGHNPTSHLVINKLRKLFDTPVESNESSSNKAQNEGSEETFETPDMEEVLRENQTADEL